MKRVILSSRTRMSLVVDEEKLYNLASNILNAGGVGGPRDEEIDWSMYTSPEQVEIETILYGKYALQDGEDYQILNGLSILPRDPEHPVWSRIKLDIC